VYIDSVKFEANDYLEVKNDPRIHADIRILKKAQGINTEPVFEDDI
jgi:hypothetical protein